MADLRAEGSLQGTDACCQIGSLAVTGTDASPGLPTPVCVCVCGKVSVGGVAVTVSQISPGILVHFTAWNLLLLLDEHIFPARFCLRGSFIYLFALVLFTFNFSMKNLASTK